jgi:hypothetical protein
VRAPARTWLAPASEKKPNAAAYYFKGSREVHSRATLLSLAHERTPHARCRITTPLEEATMATRKAPPTGARPRELRAKAVKGMIAKRVAGGATLRDIATGQASGKRQHKPF